MNNLKAEDKSLTSFMVCNKKQIGNFAQKNTMVYTTRNTCFATQIRKEAHIFLELPM